MRITVAHDGSIPRHGPLDRLVPVVTRPTSCYDQPAGFLICSQRICAGHASSARCGWQSRPRLRRAERGSNQLPGVTWKLPIRVNVPCRSYSNSIRAGFPAIISLVGRSLQRLNARHLVDADGVGILGRSKRCRAVRVADRLDLLLKLLRVFSVVLSQYRLLWGCKAASRR